MGEVVHLGSVLFKQLLHQLLLPLVLALACLVALLLLAGSGDLHRRGLFGRLLGGGSGFDGRGIVPEATGGAVAGPGLAAARRARVGPVQALGGSAPYPSVLQQTGRLLLQRFLLAFPFLLLQRATVSAVQLSPATRLTVARRHRNIRRSNKYLYLGDAFLLFLLDLRKALYLQRLAGDRGLLRPLELQPFGGVARRGFLGGLQGLLLRQLLLHYLLKPLFLLQPDTVVHVAPISCIPRERE